MPLDPERIPTFRRPNTQSRFFLQRSWINTALVNPPTRPTFTLSQRQAPISIAFLALGFFNSQLVHWIFFSLHKMPAPLD